MLGKTGRNFAAGMSGGIAYVLDDDGDFASRCNLGMVELEPLEARTIARRCSSLLHRHYEYTGSTVAWRILSGWKEYGAPVRQGDAGRVPQGARQAAARFGRGEARSGYERRGTALAVAT